MKKRFTEQEKYEAVKMYLKGKYSYCEVSEIVGVDRKSVRKWVGLYKTHGIHALSPRSSCTSYDAMFKLEVLNYRTENSASYLDTAITDGKCVFKKVECLSSKKGKVTKKDKALVIYELRHEFSVKDLVKLAGIPRSIYYHLVKQMNRPDPDAALKQEIQSIYEEHEGRYGYRRIRDELANRGKKVNHKKV